MRLRTVVLLVIGAALANAAEKAAAQQPTAVSREALLEFQILANREKEIKEKIQPLYDMLMEPVQQARSAAVERVCKAANIPLQENGQPVCEVDPKAGTVRRIAAPGEVKKQ